MHTALFILYFLLLCFAISRMRFFRNGIKPAYMVLFFALHVFAGCLHTWIAFRFFPHHGDIWVFFQESLVMKERLLTHPIGFLKHITNNDGFNIKDKSVPILDIQYSLLQYSNVLLNFFSANNFYINTLLFSFPVFAGTMALFNVFYSVFRKPLPACCAVLLPSVLFWTALVYKDGLLYMAIGCFFYYFFKPGRPQLQKGIFLLCCLVLMFVSRANALISFCPAVFFLALMKRKSFTRRKAFGLTVVLTVVAVLVFHAWLPGGLATRISERQHDFQLLSGGSRIYLPALTPAAISFLYVFPAALVNGFFQPLPGAGGQALYLAFFAELLLVWLIIIGGCLLLWKNKNMRLSNFDLGCLLFALPGLIIIGYMIPFAGAIIRYRSIYLPFLLAPFVNLLCTLSFKPVQAINNWLSATIMALPAGKA